MTLCTKIEIKNDCYSNNQSITSVNTNNVPYVNNDASYAFYNCNGITTVTGLNPNITNMSHAFEYVWQNTASYAGVINVTLPTSLQDASYIFKNRPGELEITLPSSITNAYMAFESCYHIKKVTGELYNCSNMQSMYEWALYGTNNSYNLANYTASQAENIDMSRCFYQCQKLQVARPLPPNVTNLSRCFYNTNLTTNLAIPNKVQNMSCCYYRTNITTIPVLPDSVEDISYCFTNCNFVTTATVTIPQNVVNASWAFMDCNNITAFNFQSQKLADMSHFTANVWNDPRLKKLQKVEGFLPNTLQNMANAFLNCPQLTNFCGSNTAEGCVFPDDVEDMSCCFDLCPNLSGNFTLPTNLVNGYQLHYGSSSKVINYYGTLNKVEDISDIFYSGGINRKINLTISLNNLTNSSRAFQGCTGLTADQITFTGASTNIVNAYATFWGDTNLTSVPNGFENIKPYTLTSAFGNCTNLFSADFSNMDTSALRYMTNTFSYCYKLNTFSIQINNAPSLNLYDTFAYCNALRYLTLNISDCPDVIFSNTFNNCQALWRIPNITNSTITSFPSSTFYKCHYLSGFINWNNTNFSNDVTSLSNMFANKGYITGIDADFRNSYAITNMDNTFQNCVRLTSFNFDNLPPNLTAMNSCFSNCPNLSGQFVWNHPNRVTAQWAFAHTNFSSVDIISNIGSWHNAFGFCNNIQYVNTLPRFVTDLDSAFQSCKNIKSVGDLPSYYGNSVSGARNTFLSCTGLLSAGNIVANVSPYSGTFLSCSNLKTVGDLVVNGGNTSEMFRSCSNLTTFNSISLSGEVNATNMFYGCSKLNYPVNLEALDATSNIVSMFDGCSSIAIPIIIQPVSNHYRMLAGTGFSQINCADFINTQNSITSFYGTFQNCSNLTEVQLVNGVNYAWTFQGCSNSFNVTCPTPLDGSYLYGTFNASNIKSIDLNNSALTYIDYAFFNCHSFTSLSGLNTTSLTSVPSAFYWCNNLTTLNATPYFPNVSNFAQTFYGCQKLTGDFQDLQNLFPKATNMASTFYNCKAANFANVTLPNTITNMSSCFYSTSIKKIELPDTDHLVNYSGIFTGCSQLTDVTGYLNHSGQLNYYSVLGNNMGNIINFTVNIGNSVTNLSNAFSGYVNGSSGIYGYISMQHGPLNFGGAVNMHNTFWNCSNLVSVGNIPNTVTNMYNTFWNCQNLTGDLYIESNQVANATGCFNGTSLPKNVYIPFTYANGVYTQTYNTFNAIYGTGANGVTLLNYTELYE